MEPFKNISYNRPCAVIIVAGREPDHSGLILRTHVFGLPAESNSTSENIPCRFTKADTLGKFAGKSTFIKIILTFFSVKAIFNESNTGNSLIHGLHHEAQKLIMRTVSSFVFNNSSK
jgi:hypothetical protein